MIHELPYGAVEPFGAASPIVDSIQTDLATHPGCSGGPLINVETDEAVGINWGSRKTGITFSVQINRVRDIINELAQGHEIQHAYLGIAV